MSLSGSTNDRVLGRIVDTIETVLQEINVEIISIILYGSKARGDRNSKNDYEILVLIENGIKLDTYIQLNDSLKLQLLKEKLLNAKIQTYTPDSFEKILYNDKITGTFLYMICKECIVLYDKSNAFRQVKEQISFNSVKDEEIFINQCIEFARSFNSDKWAQKWEKTLMQYKYAKKRKSV